jgi:hypothetical protein
METLHSGAPGGTIFPAPANFGTSWNTSAMEAAVRAEVLLTSANACSREVCLEEQEYTRQCTPRPMHTPANALFVAVHGTSRLLIACKALRSDDVPPHTHAHTQAQIKSSEAPHPNHALCHTDTVTGSDPSIGSKSRWCGPRTITSGQSIP